MKLTLSEKIDILIEKKEDMQRQLKLVESSYIEDYTTVESIRTAIRVYEEVIALLEE